MNFRSLKFSLLNWIILYAIMILLLSYVIPNNWGAWSKAFPMWVAGFILAFELARLAFSKKTPGIREAVQFVLLWLIVQYTLDVFYSIYQFQTAIVVWRGIDGHLTHAFQVLAIALAAYTVRRKNVKDALSEGLSE